MACQLVWKCTEPVQYLLKSQGREATVGAGQLMGREGIVPPEASPLLEVERLTVRFGGLVGLSEVSFTISQGELVALIGPNGAGKTTLLNVLTGLVRPTTGRILFRGRDVTRNRSDQLSRQGISRTFQLVRLFPGLSVLDNIRVGAAFGRSTESSRPTADDLWHIMAMTDLRHLAQRHAGSLAIGDRKRLEIARALATAPSLLLLDELIAGLAPPDTRALIELIRSIHRQGVTIIMIEHIMPAVLELADRIIVLHHGEKIAAGPPAQVVRNPVVIEAYLGMSPVPSSCQL
jgi:branched-chain amino acid transport system ATP-binding protein